MNHFQVVQNHYVKTIYPYIIILMKHCRKLLTNTNSFSVLFHQNLLFNLMLMLMFGCKTTIKTKDILERKSDFYGDFPEEYWPKHWHLLGFTQYYPNTHCIDEFSVLSASPLFVTRWRQLIINCISHHTWLRSKFDSNLSTHVNECLTETWRWHLLFIKYLSIGNVIYLHYKGFLLNNT